MKTTMICAVLATMISFSSAWLLARLSMAAVLLCMPRGATPSVLAKRSDRRCA
ncbi:MAG: hypothetical protein KGL59_06165 [Acidobacteriota bacterium]|nr:hypothetical protein [Acidobacteriota bacterium]